MGRFRVLAVGAALAAVTGAAVGCSGASGSAPPATGLPSGSSPTSSPTASVTVAVTPTVPPAAQAHTKAGAEAFVRFYVDRYNQAGMKPEAGVLKPLSDANCVACQNIEADLSALVQSGHRYANPPLAVPDIRFVATASDGRWGFKMTLRQLSTKVLDSSGAVVDTVPAKDFPRQVAVVWRGDQWVMFDME